MTAPMRFPTLAYALVLGATFTLAIRIDSVQPDTWWALRAGQDMWHTHRFITTDTYSYTAYGQPWPDNAWLYQVLLYGLYWVGAFPLISVVNAALATLAVAIGRPKGRITWADIVGMTAVVALVSLSWSVRPQVMSLLLIAIIIRLIHAQRWILIVLLMLLWTNLHGDVVFGGLLLVGATVAALISWLLSLRRGDPSESKARRGRLIRFALTTIASAGVTLINPLGFGLWRYLDSASSRPGQQWIAEWQPSWTAPWITGWFWIWTGLLVVLVLLRWRRLLQWPLLLSLCLALVIAPFAWIALRNISAFGVVTLPLLILLLRRQPSAETEAEPELRPGSVMPGARVMLALAALACVVSATRTLHTPVGLGWYPMSSRAAKAIEACPGHVYTTYNSGAYLIWFAPGQKVFVDNRQDPYDEETLEFGVGSGDFTSVFAKYDIRCAALNVNADPQQIVVLGAMARWNVAYADSDWVVLTDPRTVRIVSR